jgi:hypothetical protein
VKPVCLTGIRMSMSATLLHQNDNYSPSFPDLDVYGTWEQSQDPLTGEIVRIWVPLPGGPVDDPDTPSQEVTLDTIKCIARGIVDGGIRVAGTTERFGETYENIDYVKMWVGSNVRISKRDRITNITDRRGRVQWRDEESASPDTPIGEVRATVFNVNGVTPLFDAFNNHVESFVLLERAENYGGEE